MVAVSRAYVSNAAPWPKRGFTKFPREMSGRFRPSAAAVWLALRSFHNMTDGSRPAIRTVMIMTGLGRTSVKSAIHEVLVPAGVLSVSPRGDGSRPNRYSFSGEGDRFTMWPNEYWVRGLSAAQIAVLLVLLSVKDLEYGAMPGTHNLAQQARVGTDTVRRSIEELKAMGLVAVHRDNVGTDGRWRRHRYTFLSASDTEHLDISHASHGPEGIVVSCDVTEADCPGTWRRPPLYLTSTAPVPGGGREEDSNKNTEVETLKVERLRSPRAPRVARTALEVFQPPAAEPEAGGLRALANRSERLRLSRRGSAGEGSRSKYRNFLRDSTDAEDVVELWEELRGPAKNCDIRKRWVNVAYQLLVEDNRAIDEILLLTQWVAHDTAWSRRVKTPCWLRGRTGSNYAELLAEAKTGSLAAFDLSPRCDAAPDSNDAGGSA